MPANIKTVTTIKDLRNRVGAWRNTGKKIVLVPTMGALHEGHLSLVKLARKNGDRILVSIFVNPAQFAPHEDFDSYPREHEKDLEKLAELGVDLVFMPPRNEVYPRDFSTHVTVEGPERGTLRRVSTPFFRWCGYCCRQAAQPVPPGYRDLR